MSSWSLLHALSGFSWDAVEGRLAFAPKIHAARFRGLFIVGTGWGSFDQRRAGSRLSVRLQLLAGRLDLRRLELDWPGGRPPAGIGIARGPEETRLRRSGRTLQLDLPTNFTLSEGERLHLVLEKS
jgi:hypothetical protein